MRLHRISLRNYRGVEESDVQFAETGVTIVEGRNEVGKSSLAEALDLLLSVPDSSKSSRVRSIQPVHRDVGPEVEVELSTGPYRLVYSKRWAKRPETRLEVLAPRHQQLTGREAHDRVEEILSETLDAELFAALRLSQGGELSAPGFDVSSLSRALDVASADDRAGDREDALWDRIRVERDRYWTATGQPRGERNELARAVASSMQIVEERRAAIERAEADVSEVASLDRELASIAKQLGDQRSHVSGLELQASGIDELRHELDRLLAHEQAAEADAHRWNAAATRRAELVDDARRARDGLHKCEAEALGCEPARVTAARRLDAARAAAEESQQQWAAAEAAHQLAAADCDFRRREIEIDQLTERRDRVIEARERLATAEAGLAHSAVDDEVVAEIEAAHIAVVRAEAVAATGAAIVEIEATAAFALEVDGDSSTLEQGSTSEHRVGDRMVLRLGDLATVRVSAGEESRLLAGRLDDARAELQRRCEAAGVDGLAAARRVASERVQAERERAEALAAIDRDLRDLTLEELSAKVDRLIERVAAYRAARGDLPPLPADLDRAQAELGTAERRLDGLGASAERADAALRSAVEAQHDAATADASTAILLDHARAGVERAEAALLAAREECADEQLDAHRREAVERKGVAAAAVVGVRAELQAADADSMDVRLKNASEALIRAEASHAERTERRIAVLSRLEFATEQGLGQLVAEAEAELARLERAHAQIEARAHAALHLHDTFAARRDQARDRYATPFRSRIDELGRIVYDVGFAVELDDELRVARRRLGGVTVEFDDLSTGAKEQLGILSRLACAMIVSADGGAPVIFDDALGWTDAERLERMGAAIAVAARTCQVIVMTSTPSRYSTIGSAKVVSLTRRDL